VPLLPHARLGWCVGAALVVGAFVACESPFEPLGEGERVPIGREITDDVSGDTVARYSFMAEGGGPYVVFLAALDGAVHLSVSDSTDPYGVGFVSAGPASPPLYENATSTFPTDEGDVYQVRVSASPAGSHARFRFVVYPINTSPERHSGVFAFGDSVAGETIDPMVDLDQFIVHGQAGQEFVAVAETQGPPGSGSVALVVIDPVANDFLGYVFADAGTATPLTTGRVRLPATRDYQFTFGSVTSNLYPRYRGPYRFWSYLINRAPEHRAAAIAFNTETGNERIDRAGDVDEFTFVANPGTDFNAFVQGGGRTFQLEVARQESSTPFAVATSHPSDTALFAHPTNRFRITQAGVYVVRLTGTNPSEVADTGAYRVYLYAIDPRPERVPSAVAPGDTVAGEDIGLPGDVDEFTFTGATGEEFNAFVQAQDGSSETRLQLEVLGPTGTALRSAQSVGTDTSLLRQPTGRFALPTAGTYRLRVSGVPSYPADLNRGAYRLFLSRIDRKPETLPETLALGDSLTGEAIDVPGDIDEFRVTVADSSGANLAIELEAAPAPYNALSIQLIDVATGQSVAAAGTSLPGVRLASGRVLLAPGTYILRIDVSQYEERPVLRGSYRLWLYRFGFGPEVVPDTFAIGDTVSGEVIEPWGDADLFHFYGTRGQHVNIAFQGMGYPSGTAFQAWIQGPPGAPEWVIASVTSPTSAAALHDHQTMRLDLPATGWYHITVSATGAAGSLADRGPYRLAVEPLGTAPELAASALAPGDSVTTESIDTPGDWDEFTVTATPGQELNAIFQGNPAMNGYAQIRVRDAASGDSLAGNVGQGTRIVGPFRVPASGQVIVSVYQGAGFVRFCYDATCNGVFGLVGPYAFRVAPLTRAPETAPAAVTVGDTVRGEELTPIGDLDEFRVSATPGANLSLNARLLANPVPTGGIIWLDVLDPATGTVLSSGSGLIGGSPTSPFYSLASVVVPASGSVLFRFRGYSRWGDEVATAPYEFFVKP